MPTNVVAAVLSHHGARAMTRGGGSTRRRHVDRGVVPERSRRRTTISARGCSTCASRATRSSSNGTKRSVDAAPTADLLLVTGRTGDGLTNVLVPSDTPGVTIRTLRSTDLTRRFGAVDFDDVRVPLTALVGEVGGADDEVEWATSLGLTIAAAESVGAMEAAFDMTVEWAFDRYSFGRPLASYQALKHRFADMQSWLDASHAIADRGRGGGGHRRPAGGECRPRRGGLHRPVRPRPGPRLRADPQAASASRSSTTCTCTCGASSSTRSLRQPG